MIQAPVWKDIVYSAATSSLTYYITADNNETIFNGRAFAKPNEGIVYININKIILNYLINELPDFRSYSAATFSAPMAYRTFYLYNTNGTLLETYSFLYDWSYTDEADFVSTYSLSRPINNHYAEGMYSFNTVLSSGQVTNNLEVVSGSSCGEYAIYYLNAFGGWDSFLFEGKCRKYNNFTQYEYNRVFNNTTIEFEKNRYISEVEEVYELSTGLLADDEADNFALNLIGTNQAYLHNLSTGDIFPIMIDESSIEYKKYRNDRKITEYTIRVKSSQNKIRR